MKCLGPGIQQLWEMNLQLFFYGTRLRMKLKCTLYSHMCIAHIAELLSDLTSHSLIVVVYCAVLSIRRKILRSLYVPFEFKHIEQINSNKYPNQIYKIQQDWLDVINDNRKSSQLRILRLVKTDYRLKPHVLYTGNKKHQRALTRLRITSHKLNMADTRDNLYREMKEFVGFVMPGKSMMRYIFYSNANSL